MGIWDDDVVVSSNVNCNKARILLIDTNALVYRSFYAMQDMVLTLGREISIGEWHGKKNEYITPFFIFIRVILKAIQDIKPDIIIALDDETSHFRYDLYPNYKSERRQKMDADREKMNLIQRNALAIREFLKHINIPVVTQYGKEADDLAYIITASDIMMNGVDITNESTLMYITGDNDWLQLFDTSTGCQNKELYLFKTTSKQELYLSKEAVEATLGYPMGWFCWGKAVCGDKSDSISGIHGVGEAIVKLLSTVYATPKEAIESEYNKIANKKSAVKKLLDSKDILERNSLLMDLSRINERQVISLLTTKNMDFASDRLLNTIEALGFASILKTAAKVSKLYDFNTKTKVDFV